MTNGISRRQAVGLFGGAFAASVLPHRASEAAARALSVTHEANKGAATTGAGGDVTAAWRTANDCDITWITLDVQATSDRLLREASSGRPPSISRSRRSRRRVPCL